MRDHLIALAAVAGATSALLWASPVANATTVALVSFPVVALTVGQRSARARWRLHHGGHNRLKPGQPLFIFAAIVTFDAPFER